MTQTLEGARQDKVSASERPAPCLGCGGVERRVRFQDLPDRLQGRPGRFTYTQCIRCGLTQLSNIPEDISSYYENYGPHQEVSAAYQGLRRLLLGACYPLPKGSGEQVLDIGCGSGWYLRALQQRGWQPHGFEMNREIARSASERLGCPVYWSLDQLFVLEGACAMVSMHFVFEHARDPRALLAAAARCVAPGGRIVISVPNLDGREAALFGDLWYHLDPPRHLAFLPAGLLKRWLNEAGFARVSVKNLPVPTGWAGSISYKLTGKLHPWIWAAGMLPGWLFSRVIRDGNMQVTGVRA